MSLVKLLSHGSNPNWLEAELTDEERELVKPHASIPGFFTTDNLGYIDPSKVKRYFSGECNEIYHGSPRLDVTIHFKDRWSLIAGHYGFFYPLDEDDIDLILDGPILVKDIEEKKINPEYVTQDNSGMVIPITSNRIESEIERGIKRVNEGFKQNFLDAERLAKVAGLEEEFSEKIKSSREYSNKKYVEKYSLRENLEDTLSSFEEWADWSFVGLGDHPLTEKFDEFIGIAEMLKYPHLGLRKRATNLLANYINFINGDITSEVDEIKKHVKSIRDLRDEQKKIKLLIYNIQNSKSS